MSLRLENNRKITNLFRIGEQYGLFAIVRVKEVEDYGSFIKELYETEDIEDTWTNFVLDELAEYTNFRLYWYINKLQLWILDLIFLTYVYTCISA